MKYCRRCCQKIEGEPHKGCVALDPRWLSGWESPPPPESSDDLPWEELTPEDGWEIVSFDGITAFPFYRPGALRPEFITYKVYRPHENRSMMDGGALGLVDSLYVRVKWERPAAMVYRTDERTER